MLGSLMHIHPIFRAATETDAETLTQVYLTSRREFVSCAPLAHTDEEVYQWISESLIPTGQVTVVEHESTVVGMMALSADQTSGWIDHLYVHPSAVGRGIGTRLLERAKAELGSPIRLYTFQANHGAQRFYERHGFKAIEYGDGSGNEEKCPDILYEWRH